MSLAEKPPSKHIWQESLTAAEKITQVRISPITRVYLVHTIDQYMTDNSLCDHKPLGQQWLEAQTGMNDQVIQNIGDRCLIISSIFPEKASSRNTDNAFYCQIGQNAYRLLAKQSSQIQTRKVIFHELSTQFLPIAHTLSYMRHN